MKANKIEPGKTYEISVGKNITSVRVERVERRVNGTLVFHCENTKTGKTMTVADAERFHKEIKPINPPDRTQEAAKAKEDTALRENIAKTLVEAGAEPKHVEAAKVAMAVQAAEKTREKNATDYSSGDQITLKTAARWTNSTGNGRQEHHLPPGTTLTLQTRKPEGWECKTPDGEFFFLFNSYLMPTETQAERGKGGKTKGTISGLDAAAQVLADSEAPLNVKQITERAITIGWAPEGQTPSATLAAALIREIARKGDESRFTKVAAGLFARK